MSYEEVETWARTLAEHPDIEDCISRKVEQGMDRAEAEKKCREEAGTENE